MRNFRHRGGYNGTGEKDCLTIMVGNHNIALLNLSMSGSFDEVLGIWDTNYDITVQDCILGGGDDAGERYGILCSNYNRRVTYFGNLIHDSCYRMPAVGYDVSDTVAAPSLTADVVCNVIWKYETMGVTVYHGGKANVRNNYFYTVVYPGVAWRAVNVETLGEAYASGNYSRDGASTSGSVGTIFAVDAYAQISALTPAQALARVQNIAGCRVGGLDAYDQAVLAGVV